MLFSAKLRRLIVHKLDKLAINVLEKQCIENFCSEMLSGVPGKKYIGWSHDMTRVSFFRNWLTGL